MAAKTSQEEIMQLLDKLYDQSIHGIAKVSPPIEELANSYLEKSNDTATAAKKFINYQVAKCTTCLLYTSGGSVTAEGAVLSVRRPFRPPFVVGGPGFSLLFPALHI